MTRWILVAAFALVGGATVCLVLPELAPAAAVTGLIACLAGACVSVWG